MPSSTPQKERSCQSPGCCGSCQGRGSGEVCDAAQEGGRGCLRSQQVVSIDGTNLALTKFGGGLQGGIGVKQLLTVGGAVLCHARCRPGVAAGCGACARRQRQDHGRILDPKSASMRPCRVNSDEALGEQNLRELEACAICGTTNIDKSAGESCHASLPVFRIMN
eukprot:407735-Rhodomonas_salina.1